MDIKLVGKIMKRALIQWQKDRCDGMAAALSYFAVLSFAPFVACIILLFVFFMGKQEVLAKVIPIIQERLGPEARDLFFFLMRHVSESHLDLSRVSILGLIVMLGAASAYFEQLQDSFEFIWGKVHGEAGLVHKIKKKVFGVFLAFLSSGAWAGSLLSRIWLESSLSTPNPSRDSLGGLSNLTDFLLTFLLMSVLAGIVLRWFVPEKLPGRKVFIGAAIIGLLHMIGRIVAGKILGKGDLITLSGAAGGIVILLLWVYYNSLAILYGAEIVREYCLLKD
jgi:membrane protein